jgi:valyl-tRNA synthetase
VDTNGCVTVVTNDAKLYMPLAELVDIEKERDRITKELEKARANLAGLLKKLENENFVSKAPEAVVNAEREKAEKARALIENLEESLKAFS